MNTVQARTTEFPPVLIASANDALRQSLVEKLQCNRWCAEEAFGGADALAKLEASECRFLLLDAKLPDLDSQELSAMVKARYPGVQVVMLEAMAGVSSRMTSRPVAGAVINQATAELAALLNPDSSLSLISGIVKPEAGQSTFCGPQYGHPDASEPLPGMVGNSPAMRRVYRLTRKIAPRTTPVLIVGGTGTGKELVAQALHQLSPRSSRPLVIINCAAIPEALLESELFGYVRGAFTGAAQSHMGRIHAAHGGTLFLDEIGDMPLNLQAKLLRVVEQGDVQRLGSTEVFRIDVRILAATNADLERKIVENTFRRDLFYRLSVFPIELPPLARRAEDIVPLARHFLGKSSPNPPLFSPAAIDLLGQHSWPGNVRELLHVVERASILAEETGLIEPEHIVFSCAGQM
jgi:DNA-binding NtrC family response regulator